MRSILKREVKNYMKNPLLWLGIVIGVFTVFQNVSPYLNIHYLREGETIVNDYPQNYRDGDVSCGYVPTEKALRREMWEERIQEVLTSEFEMDNEEALSVIDDMKGMDISASCAGHIWICKTKEERTARELEKKYHVSSKQYAGDKLQMKVISETPPKMECSSCEVTLEDAYIYLANKEL